MPSKTLNPPPSGVSLEAILARLPEGERDAIRARTGQLLLGSLLKQRLVKQRPVKQKLAERAVPPAVPPRK